MFAATSLRQELRIPGQELRLVVEHARVGRRSPGSGGEDAPASLAELRRTMNLAGADHGG